MEEIEVKWSHALHVWWSWLWRTMAWVLPISFLTGVFTGIVMSILSIDVNDNLVFPQVLGGAIGIYFSVKVMKLILNKSFNGYRIALIKIEKPSEIDA